jgi:hypothetical protein
MGQSLSSLSLVHFRISLFGRLATISSSRPSFAVAPRAVTVKGRPQAVAKQLALDGHEHGGRLHWSGKSFPAVRQRRQFRGELAISGRRSRHNLVFGRSMRDRNHDAVIRIGGEAPERRAHSSQRLEKPWV